MDAKLPKIIVLLGPTASGKSALAPVLARAYGGEIINADSRQVYKELRIGTAKPYGVWRENTQTGEQVYTVDTVPHYLMDFVDITHTYTAAEWKLAADARICEITRRGRLPFVVGGTGLYIDALVQNFNMPPRSIDENIHVELMGKTTEELRDLLRTHDPSSVQMIDMRNPRRIIRALEVALATGESFAAQQKKDAPRYDVLCVGIHMPMEELAHRINLRIDAMLRDGWIDEVRALMRIDGTLDLPALNSIGYPELIAYLRGEISLEEAVRRIKIATRQYAKRQITWFKRNSAIRWITSQDQAMRLIDDFVGNLARLCII